MTQEKENQKAQTTGKSEELEVQEELEQILQILPNELLMTALEAKFGNTPEQKILAQIESETHQHYSGPIPPPKMLSQYNQVNEGFADRIISMAENEQKHRHKLESTAVQGEINKDKRGQNYALLTSLSIIVGSIGLIYTGHEVSGSILAGSSLLGLAYIFITGRKQQEEQDQDQLSD